MVSKKPPVEKDPRANELMDEVRRMYFRGFTGWIARVHHTNKQLLIGHPDYGKDDVVTSEIESLRIAIDRLGLADAIGYKLEIVTK